MGGVGGVRQLSKYRVVVTEKGCGKLGLKLSKGKAVGGLCLYNSYMVAWRNEVVDGEGSSGEEKKNGVFEQQGISYVTSLEK